MNPEELGIKNSFKDYLIEVTHKYLLTFTLASTSIVLWFSYSDLFIRENTDAFYTRLLTLVMGITLIIFQLVTKEKYKRLKFIWYSCYIISALLMMYAKYMVYLQHEGQAYSVVGIVVLIFMIALELKVSLKYSILVFFAPLIALVIAVLFFVDLPSTKIVNFSNLFPMTLIGFIANRVQYNLRFKLFKANYWLNHEKIVTKELYEESLSMNEYLEEKNLEIENQKNAIEKANEELQKLSDTKDKFFSIISHDLKTPFNAMIGFSNLLSQHYEEYTPEEQKKFISIIDESANNTYKLLTSLLEWAQAQTDNDQLKLESINLFLLVSEIFTLLKQTAEGKDIKLINQIEKTLVVNVDINKLTSVIRNLVTNAIKFTHSGGKITVNTNTIKRPSGNYYIQVTVEDTGIGIEPDKQKTLFDITQKVSTLGTHEEVGTGLGLILCQEFIKRHQGEIWVESEINKGSKFIFSLPQTYEMN